MFLMIAVVLINYALRSYGNNVDFLLERLFQQLKPTKTGVRSYFFLAVFCRMRNLLSLFLFIPFSL